MRSKLRNNKYNEDKAALKRFATVYCICVAFLITCTMFVSDNRSSKHHMNLLPKNNTTLSFVINPSRICKSSCGNRLFLVIFVITKAARFSHRRIIRKTWGKSTDCMKVVFVFDQSNDDDITDLAAVEGVQHGDIIQSDLLETNSSLRAKHVTCLRWAARYCPQAQYIIKIEDHIIINTPLLYKVFDNFLNYRGLVVGSTPRLEQPPEEMSSLFKTVKVKESSYKDVKLGFLDSYMIFTKDAVECLANATKLINYPSRTDVRWTPRDEDHFNSTGIKYLDVKAKWYSGKYHFDSFLKNSIAQMESLLATNKSFNLDKDLLLYGHFGVRKHDVGEVWKNNYL